MPSFRVESWNTHLFSSSLHSPSLTHTCPQAACRGFTTSLISNTKHQLGLQTLGDICCINQPNELLINMFIRYTNLIEIPENTCIIIEMMNYSHCTFSILCSGNLWAILAISELKVFRISRSACSTKNEHHMLQDVPSSTRIFRGLVFGRGTDAIVSSDASKNMPMLRKSWNVQVE